MIMKNSFDFQIVYKLFLMLSIISCNENKPIEKSKSQIKTIEITNSNPLFLSFSPLMTKEQFNNEIQEKTWDGTLTLGKFIIPINNNNFEFEILKNEKSIELNYSETQNIHTSNLNKKNSRELLDNNNEVVHQFVKMFRTKNEYTEFEMPKLNNPSQNTLELNDILLFRNKERSVLLRYSTIGSIVMSKSENSDYYNNLERENPNDPLIALGRFIKKDESAKFGLFLSLEYYYNKDMDSLLKSILDKKESKIKKELEIENYLKEFENKSKSKATKNLEKI